jgi:hypothetical protein
MNYKYEGKWRSGKEDHQRGMKEWKNERLKYRKRELERVLFLNTFNLGG